MFVVGFIINDASFFLNRENFGYVGWGSRAGDERAV
jgi:hypothetical protein